MSDIDNITTTDSNPTVPSEFDLAEDEVETTEQLIIIAALSKLAPIGEVTIDGDTLTVEIKIRNDAPWTMEQVENALFDLNWMVYGSNEDTTLESGEKSMFVEAERIDPGVVDDPDADLTEEEFEAELTEEEVETENTVQDGKAEPPAGWWDGPQFRAGPAITSSDLLKHLPPTGKIDVIGISGELGCTAAHVRNMLRDSGIKEREDHTFWMDDPRHVVTETPHPIDPEDMSAVDALEVAIKALTPEAREQAIKIGLLPKEKPTYVPRKKEPKLDADGNPIVATKTPRTPKVVEMHECACGCGGLTKSAFCMGHDARAKGLLLRLISGKLTQTEMSWRPNDNLVTYVHSHPDWEEKFGVVMTALSTPVSLTGTEVTTEDVEDSDNLDDIMTEEAMEDNSDDTDDNE